MLRQRGDLWVRRGLGAVMSGSSCVCRQHIPEHARLAHAARVALESAVRKRRDHKVDVARGFGVGECAVGGHLLQAVEVGDASGARRGSGIAKQAEDAGINGCLR